MKFTILTLFPEMFSALEHSIIKRAQDAGHIQIEIVNFRDYSKDKHKRVDDVGFSGGGGMVICAQPVVDCIEAVDPDRKAHRIFLTPAAPVVTQKRIIELSKYDHVLFLCGHYEGVDQRAIDLCFDEVLSIGEFVLTGGEIPAMVLVDAIARHVSGVISAGSLQCESFSGDCEKTILEHPHYTRPREYRGLSVPEVLVSGNHAAVEKWKKQASAEVTKKYRG